MSSRAEASPKEGTAALYHSGWAARFTSRNATSRGQSGQSGGGSGGAARRSAVIAIAGLPAGNERGFVAGILRGELCHGRPVEIAAALRDHRQQSRDNQARKRHRHLEGLRRGEDEADVLMSERRLEAWRVIALRRDQSAIGVVHRRAKQ